MKKYTSPVVGALAVKSAVKVVAISLCFSVPVFAADPANGEKLAATCASCHGADGNSTIGANPKLAGQYESYLITALKAYRSGARESAIMAGFAAPLSDSDIRDLAAWFSSQESSLTVADY